MARATARARRMAAETKGARGPTRRCGHPSSRRANPSGALPREILFRNLQFSQRTGLTFGGAMSWSNGFNLTWRPMTQVLFITDAQTTLACDTDAIGKLAHRVSD